MKTIKGTIDPRHARIVNAMAASTGIFVLPKTMAASTGKPLVVLEVRR